MRQYILLILLVFSLGTVQAQRPKTVTLKQPAPIKEKEIFQVKADDEQVKDGFYRRYKSRQLVEEGFYKNGKKDSTWRYFTISKEPVASGDYKDGEKVGYWTFYSKSGRMVQRYDYDTDSLIFFDVEEERKYGYAPATYPDTAAEQMAIFIGGYFYMQTLLSVNTRYPEAAWLAKKQARLMMSFVVDTAGHVTDIIGDQPVGNGFDEEAIRMIKLLDHQWIPGIQGGKKVKVKYRLPISFKLQ